MAAGPHTRTVRTKTGRTLTDGDVGSTTRPHGATRRMHQWATKGALT